MAKKKPDQLTAGEVEAWIGRDFYQPGEAYLWVLGFGWCCVGFFARWESPFEIRVAHASYYRTAGGQTHAALARNGPTPSTAWEYHGDELLNRTQVIRVTNYRGEVPRGHVATR